MREMEVVGIRVDVPSNVPMVLLQEAGGPRMVPIWIGAHEASSIAMALEEELPPRPLTHDLFLNTLVALDQELMAVHITELSDNTFYAELVIGDHIISARPSDAIALAVRCHAPIFCADQVLDLAGVELADDEPEDEVERFREFLDHVSPDDFDLSDDD